MLKYKQSYTYHNFIRSKFSWMTCCMISKKNTKTKPNKKENRKKRKEKRKKKKKRDIKVKSY